jgi:hypothetical protein
MHLINGVRDPATSFPLDTFTDDAGECRQANRAIATSAVGLALTGRTLRVEVEGFLDPDTLLADADRIGRSIAAALAPQIPDMHSFSWMARAAQV